MVSKGSADSKRQRRWLLLGVCVLSPLLMAHTCDEPDGDDGDDGAAGSAGVGGAGGGMPGGAGGSSGASGDAGGSGEGGTAGSEGDGGTGDGGTGGSAGDAGAGGSAGVAGDGGGGGTPRCESLECGDGCWDPETEECDDGNFQSGDGCGPGCAVSDVLVGPGVASDDARPPPGRTLGDGRHPVAARSDGYAVAYVEPEGDGPRVAIRDFDARGAPFCKNGGGCDVDTTVGESASPVVSADPVLAPLADGEYMVAFVDFGGDRDGLGVAMQHVVPGEPTQSDVFFMNQTTTGAQYDPDIVWTGGVIVGAFVDSSNLDTAPDIRWRTFTDGVGAPEELLAGTTAAEFNVALAPTFDGVAVAWRESSGFVETVRARRYRGSDFVEWSVAPAFLAPDSVDRPAIIELDETHLLLVYTEAWTDETGTSHIGRLRYAVLADDSPGAVVGKSVPATAPGYEDATTISQGRPNAIRLGDELFVAWTSARVVGDTLGQEVWLKPVTWDVDDATLGVAQVERPIPREPWHREGDQRSVGLASMPYSRNDAALACAWDDRGRTFGAVAGAPDVVSELIPMPMFRNDALLEVGE